MGPSTIVGFGSASDRHVEQSRRRLSFAICLVVARTWIESAMGPVFRLVERGSNAKRETRKLRRELSSDLQSRVPLTKHLVDELPSLAALATESTGSRIHSGVPSE